MNQENKSSIEVLIITVLFIGLTLWWACIFFINNGENINANLLWAAVYQSVAILGGILGIFTSKQWGGLKSVMGRAILMFSLGLLLQSFGQTVFSYYNLIAKIEIPYPAISDFGFFGSIPLYIYGALLLAKASGANFSMRSISKKAISFIFLGLMLAFSYFFFLKGYVMEENSLLKTFLDFGYPFGQAIYVSIALLTYIFSRNYLGGIMKNYFLLIFFALLIQYASDFNFLYQASHLTWLNGGYGDFLYLSAYFLMALSLIKLNEASQKIRNS